MCGDSISCCRSCIRLFSLYVYSFDDFFRHFLRAADKSDGCVV